ncbi:MAG: sensor domain-containing diguanylate cyclase [Planctomycetes bacterium]|nr:sensor domain-containing diguanylate cyclase [Planctomycetota bacterium]
MFITNDLFKVIVDNFCMGVYLTNPEGKITYWNQGAERLMGYTHSEVLGKYSRDILIKELPQNSYKAQYPVFRAISTDLPVREEAIYFRKDGHPIAVYTYTSTLKDCNNQTVGTAEVFWDNITNFEHMRKMEQLKRLSLMDHLTNVGNRRYGEINLGIKLNSLRSYGYNFGVLFIDVDDLKHINDTRGHSAGDKVLKETASVLYRNTRVTDHLSRFGGDEFLLISSSESESDLHNIKTHIRRAVEGIPVQLGPDMVRIGLSMGLSMAQPDDTMKTLIARVDKLMYADKQSRARYSPSAHFECSY